MKKTLLVAMVALFSLSAFAPAMAAENGRFEAQSQAINNKQGLEARAKILDEIRNNPKVRWGRAELVEIKGDTLPTEIVVMADKKPMLEKVDAKLTANTNSAKLLVAQKKYTIKVDDDTIFARRYWGKSSLQELTVGDKLFLVVLDYGNDNYRALLVKDNSIFWKAVKGEIVDIDYDKMLLTLKRGNKKLTVLADNNTKYVVSGIKNPTFKDLKVGQRALARGVMNSRLKILKARLIKVMKLQPTLSADIE
ncbi:MAG: hypothetical protein ABH832_03630 [bacterium]